MRNKKTIATLLVICVTFCAAIALYYQQRYQDVKKQSYQRTAKQALHQLVYAERDYNVLKDQLVSMMQLLSHSQSLVDFATSPSVENKNLLEEVWQSVLVNQRWYTQIHLLDIDGHEKVRVNYSSRNQVLLLFLVSYKINRTTVISTMHRPWMLKRLAGGVLSWNPNMVS